MTLIPDNLSELSFAPDDWKWRSYQLTLARRIEASKKKVVLFQAEPGTGKSLVAAAAARALQKRTVILVQTRQLERQYLRDFQSLVMMEGRRHFPCEVTGETADDAPCTVGITCEMSGMVKNGIVLEPPTCPYYVRKLQASQAPISVHNYAYWLREIRGAAAFGKQDWIICDEAHEIDQILMDAGTVEIRRADVQSLGLPGVPSQRKNLAAWRTWAVSARETVTQRAEDYKDEATELGVAGTDEETGVRDIRDLMADEGAVRIMDLVRRIKALTGMREQLGVLADLTDEEIEANWVTNHRQGTYVFEPIFGKYAFQRILNAAKEKVILMSAFLAPRLLARTLGLEEDQVEIIEGGTIYDRTNSPILYCPTVMMNAKTNDHSWEFVVMCIDELIDHFAPEKGMIHVPSYKLRDFIYQHSRHQPKFIIYGGNNEDTKDDALALFANVDGHAVLLGQSISTGVDLPYIPKFNIIVKLAFLPTNDPAVKKRMQVDKDFMPFRTICQTVQATGRIKRAPDDGGPTIILDGQMGKWFWNANRQDFPSWFQANYDRTGWSRFPAIDKKRQREAITYRVIL